MASSLTTFFAQKKFNANRADLYEYIAESLEDNAELDDLIKEQLDRAKARKDSLEVIYSRWHRGMVQGKFSEAIKGTVPMTDQMIISASERTSNLVKGLKFLAFTVRETNTMVSAVRASMVTPGIMVFILLVMMFCYSKMVAPILVQIYPVEHFPVIGQYFYALSMFFSKYWPEIVASIVGAPILYAFSLPRLTGRIRLFLEKWIAPYSIYRDLQASLFLVSLASLIRSQIDFFEALKMLHSQSSPYMKWHIGNIIKRYPLQPAKPAAALQVPLFTLKIADMIVDYGKRSAFSEALEKIGVRAINKTMEIVKKSTKKIGSVMLALAGGYMIFAISATMLTSQKAKDDISAQAAGRH